jgi:hypothetical protein
MSALETCKTTTARTVANCGLFCCRQSAGGAEASSLSLSLSRSLALSLSRSRSLSLEPREIGWTRRTGSNMYIYLFIYKAAKSERIMVQMPMIHRKPHVSRSRERQMHNESGGCRYHPCMPHECLMRVRVVVGLWTCVNPLEMLPAPALATKWVEGGRGVATTIRLGFSIIGGAQGSCAYRHGRGQQTFSASFATSRLFW